MTEPSAVVLGSVHVDLIATASRLPGPGESVTGGAFVMAPGGKAGNQAGQLARLGVATAVISRVGDDVFGRYLLDGLRARGLDVSTLTVDPSRSTGASTVLAGGGDYQSIIAPGAAASITPDDVDAAFARLGRFDAFVTQLELPLPVTAHAVTRATERSAFVVVNASPLIDDPASIPAELWAGTDLLVVNRVEAAALAGFPPGGRDEARAAAARLRDRYGISTVVVTLGADGVVASWGEGELFQPSFPATVVDTVGAGDAFLGTLVAGLLGGAALPAALRRAAAAGSLAVRRRGAYDAMPSADEIDRLLADHA